MLLLLNWVGAGIELQWRHERDLLELVVVVDLRVVLDDASVPSFK